MHGLNNITDNPSLIRNRRIGLITRVIQVNNKFIVRINITICDTKIRTSESLMISMTFLNTILNNIQRRLQTQRWIFKKWPDFSNMIIHPKLLHPFTSIKLLNSPNLLYRFLITSISLSLPTKSRSQP